MNCDRRQGNTWTRHTSKSWKHEAEKAGLQWEIVIEIPALDGVSGEVSGTPWHWCCSRMTSVIRLGDKWGRASGCGTRTRKALRCKELAHTWSTVRSLPLGVFVCRPGNKVWSMMDVRLQQQNNIHYMSCWFSCNPQHLRSHVSLWNASIKQSI